MPSKWSINIQEIVKRTQKNLDRNASSGRGERAAEDEHQYLNKHVKMGFGSSQTKDKSSLLYHDLKKKLSYDSGPMGNSGNISAGLSRKDNLLGGLATQNSAKSSIRPTSVSGNNNGSS